MSTTLVLRNGTAPPARFGIRIRKVYGADPRIREHRANMFRTGIPPLHEPGVRGLAKWTLGISLFLLLFALGAASSDDGGGGAVIWSLLLGAAAIWAIYVLMRQSDVDLPATSPLEFDKMYDHFVDNSEGEALRRLSYDLSEDVFVRQSFGTFDFDTIPEAVSMPHGMALYPHTRAFTVLLAPDGFRFNLNFRHHVFANQRGLAYVCTAWDFIEDGLGPDGYRTPRVVEINQWTWRTIENLRVGEHSFVIQTVGANRVELPYIGRPPGRPAQEPGAYDWYYNTPAAQQQRQAQCGPAGSPVGPPPAPPVDNPELRRFLDDGIQRGREAAITFVNTVNSLRNEWEDRQ